MIHDELRRAVQQNGIGNGKQKNGKQDPNEQFFHGTWSLSCGGFIWLDVQAGEKARSGCYLVLQPAHLRFQLF